jgi:hypothetical protein
VGMGKSNLKGESMKLSCSNITNPEDITSQCEYKDEFPGGRNDKKLVSCCQSKDDGNSYDELVNFYETHFNQSDKNTHGDKILKSMCECCNKKGKKEWSWEDYKECVKTQLKEKGLKWG